jgi:hypothetical protein
MTIQADDFKIEQLRRVAASLGWKIIATDSTGPNIRVTLETEKSKG